MENDNKLILSKLDNIKAELDYLKEYIEDTKLTQEDLDSLEEAERDFKAGKTTRL